MKKKQFEGLCKKLVPHLSGYACKGWLLYAHPVEHILRGFCCDDSGFDPSKFTVWVFFLPLYVPTKHLHFNMGKRLKDERGCDRWWHMADAAVGDELLATVKSDGLSFLTGVERPSQVPGAVRQLGVGSDPYRMEAIAYSLVMADDFLAAGQALDSLATALDGTIPWQLEMMDRARTLASQLSTDPQSAKHQLGEWALESRSNLGL